MNATQKASQTVEVDETLFDLLDFFGPKNPYFNLIHYTAIACLSISISISVYTIIYLVRSGNGNIFKRKIGKTSSK